MAKGGTIFLDEIGDMSADLQVKVLRVLEEGEFERVGGNETIKTDARIIAATHRDLEEEVQKGNFREDLFYRLSVFPVEVPPLRERREDILQLAKHFIEQTCADFGRPLMKLTRAQAKALQAYGWPGNIRELKNVIERAVILSDGSSLRFDLAPTMPAAKPAVPDTATPSDFPGILTEADMRDFQKENLLKALEQTGWRVSGGRGAAALLGVKPTTLADRIKSYGIKKPNR